MTLCTKGNRLSEEVVEGNLEVSKELDVESTSERLSGNEPEADSSKTPNSSKDLPNRKGQNNTKPDQVHVGSQQAYFCPSNLK